MTLAHSVHPGRGLFFFSRIPPTVKMDYHLGAGQINPGAPCKQAGTADPACFDGVKMHDPLATYLSLDASAQGNKINLFLSQPRLYDIEHSRKLAKNHNLEISLQAFLEQCREFVPLAALISISVRTFLQQAEMITDLFEPHNCREDMGKVIQDFVLELIDRAFDLFHGLTVDCNLVRTECTEPDILTALG